MINPEYVRILIEKISWQNTEEEEKNSRSLIYWKEISLDSESSKEVWN
jgi:hypothetical protein